MRKERTRDILEGERESLQAILQKQLLEALLLHTILVTQGEHQPLLLCCEVARFRSLTEVDGLTLPTVRDEDEGVEEFKGLTVGLVWREAVMVHPPLARLLINV